jgi:sugar phosphate isomerase/epimerase
MKTPVTKNFELSYPVDVTNWDGKMITLKSDAEIKAQINVLKNAGINWCMIAGFQIEEPLDFDIYEGAKACGELFEAEGMKISSHHSLFPAFASLSGSQDEVRAKMKENIDFSALLKTEVLVVHPGRIDGRHADGNSINNSFEQEMARSGLENIIDVVADNFRFMGEYAARSGIKLALENTGRFEPLGSIDVLPRLIEKINMANVGYCLDSGHAHAFGESVTDWVEIAGDKLFTTHFHDNCGKLAGVELAGRFIQANKLYDEHRSPGFGTINWIKVINSLRKINYRRPVNFETCGWPVDDKDESYKEAIAWWRTCETISYGKIKQD